MQGASADCYPDQGLKLLSQFLKIGQRWDITDGLNRIRPNQIEARFNKS
jgi:hypothetical protein